MLMGHPVTPLTGSSPGTLCHGGCLTLAHEQTTVPLGKLQGGMAQPAEAMLRRPKSLGTQTWCRTSITPASKSPAPQRCQHVSKKFPRPTDLAPPHSHKQNLELPPAPAGSSMRCAVNIPHGLLPPKEHTPSCSYSTRAMICHFPRHANIIPQRGWSSQHGTGSWGLQGLHTARHNPEQTR